MNQDRRRPVVTALIKLAASDDYRDRAAAGRALANFAEATESRESLLRLVLDVDDTFVTRATAEALLRRQDTAGFTIVAESLVSADFQHRTYIPDLPLVAVRLCPAARIMRQEPYPTVGKFSPAVGGREARRT